jgi:hypothetical protein
LNTLENLKGEALLQAVYALKRNMGIILPFVPDFESEKKLLKDDQLTDKEFQSLREVLWWDEYGYVEIARKRLDINRE